MCRDCFLLWISLFWTVAMKSILSKIITQGFPELLKEDGSINHNALARLTGIPQPTITRLLNDQIKDPSSNTIDQLATALEVNPAQLRGYITLPPSINSIRESAEPYAARVLFGLTLEQAAGYAKALRKLTNAHLDKIHVKADAPYSASSFFIRAPDKANEPEIHLADIIVIDPEASAKPGDFVLAQTKEDGLVLRRFAKKSPRIYALEAANKHFPTYEITNDSAQQSIIGTLVELRRMIST